MRIVKEVIKILEEMFEIPKGSIISHSRLRRVVRARKIAHYVARCVTPLSFNELSLQFNKNHSVINENYKYFEERNRKDLPIAEEIIHTLRMEAIDGDLRAIKGRGRGDCKVGDTSLA